MGKEPYSRALISPRLTTAYLETLLVFEDYHHFPGTRVTVCCLKVVNDQTMVGVSTCGESARFDITEGRKVARRNALAALKDSENYLLRQRLYEHRKGILHE
jgi:hypothetical protein